MIRDMLTVRSGFLLLSLAVYASSGMAQMATVGPIEAGHGAFQVGYMKLDLKDFNSALTGAGYPSIDDGFLTLGGAGYGGPGRWLIGGEGHALVGPSKTTTAGTYQLSLGGGYGMLRLGYNLLERPNADFYPAIGIGGGGVAFNIKGRSVPNFSDVLTTPGRSSSMTQGGFMLGASLTANYRVTMPMKDTSRVGGLLFGATAGYVLNPANSGWRLDGINTVAGGPDVKLEGWYARFSIGGWSRGPRRHR